MADPFDLSSLVGKPQPPSFEDQFQGKNLLQNQTAGPVSPEPQLIKTEKAKDSKRFLGMSENDVVNEEISAMVNTRKRVSEEYRRPKRLKWDKCLEHIFQIYDTTGKASWQARNFMPASIKVAETIIANLHGALMGPNMPAEFQAKNTRNDKRVREHNEIMENDIDRSKFKVQFTDFIRNIGYLGNGIGKIEYTKEQANVSIKEEIDVGNTNSILEGIGIDPLPSERFVRKLMTVKDYANFKNIDPYKFYPQPNIQEITKDTWCIEEFTITNAELLKLEKHPDKFYQLSNITDELLASGQSDSEEYDPEQAIRRMALLKTQSRRAYMDPDREHTVHEYWGPVPKWFFDPSVRGEGKENYESVYAWIWVIDRKWVVRKRANPYRDAEPPYIKGDYIRIPNNFWGLGPVEMMIGLQIEKNELRNTRTDNINMIVNKIVGVMKDSIEDYDRLISGPGNIWVFKGIEDIRKAFMTIDMQDISKDSWLGSQEIDNEIQETTGANQATLGTGGRRDEGAASTFRGQALNKQTSTEKFMVYARVLEICGLGASFKKMYDRVYQFKTLETARRILGPGKEDFQFIVPEMMDDIAKIQPLGVISLESKGIRLGQLDQFSKRWEGRPWLKEMELARKEWVELGYANPDDVIFSDEEHKQLMDFKRQGLLEGGGAGGGQPSPGGPSDGPSIGGAPQKPKFPSAGRPVA